jgi:hypothetical protein
MLTTKPRRTALEMNQQSLGEKSLIYLTSVNGLVFPKASSPYASNSATLDSNGIEVLLLKSIEKRICIYTNIQGVSKRALQFWKRIEIYTEDIHNVLNCQNVAKHTEFYLG